MRGQLVEILCILRDAECAFPLGAITEIFNKGLPEVHQRSSIHINALLTLLRDRQLIQREGHRGFYRYYLTPLGLTYLEQDIAGGKGKEDPLPHIKFGR